MADRQDAGRRTMGFVAWQQCNRSSQACRTGRRGCETPRLPECPPWERWPFESGGLWELFLWELFLWELFLWELFLWELFLWELFLWELFLWELFLWELFLWERRPRRDTHSAQRWSRH
jgi:hypothetical protein